MKMLEENADMVTLRRTQQITQTTLQSSKLSAFRLSISTRNATTIQHPGVIDILY